MWVPSRRSIFPLVICQRPLARAIGIHHKELGIGLRNVVVERRLVFESETGTAERMCLPSGDHTACASFPGDVVNLLKPIA